MNNDLITLTLAGSGKKVYVNPAQINYICQNADNEDTCFVVFGVGAGIEVLESANTVAVMADMPMDALSTETKLVEKILAAGKEGKEVRIYIGGRLFEVRELAQ